MRTLIILCLLTSTEEIPLKEVWAYRMPGTQEVQKLDVQIDRSQIKTPEELIEKSFVESIRAALQKRDREDRHGFAVSGIDSQALKAAHSVLALKQKPPKEVAGNVSLVFYALSGPRIELDKVERAGNVITIKWHFYSRSELSAWDTFALIPFNDLPPGKYEVRFERQPSKSDGFARPVEGPQAEKMVKTFLCTPFHFKVL